jgi:hypothetical protein
LNDIDEKYCLIEKVVLRRWGWSVDSRECDERNSKERALEKKEKMRPEKIKVSRLLPTSSRALRLMAVSLGDFE